MMLCFQVSDHSFLASFHFLHFTNSLFHPPINSYTHLPPVFQTRSTEKNIHIHPHQQLFLLPFSTRQSTNLIKPKQRMRTRVILQQTPATTTITTAISPSYHPPRSPWHSPIPYLFGGLAAMLGLIAFALLILACSYWRLSSSYDENGDEEEGKAGEGEFKVSPVFEEKILVIMAGEDMPTYLATPRFTKAALVVAQKKIVMGQGEEKEGSSEEEAQDQNKTRDESEGTQENRDREQQQQHSPLSVDHQ